MTIISEWTTAKVRRCPSTGVDINMAYQTFGNKDTGSPLMLIMGLGGSGVVWADDFVIELAEKHGFFVVRYDNRDAGRSTMLDSFKPTPLIVGATMPKFLWPKVAYQLKDMADDCVALMDHLKLEKAHIFGVSMGGMIGQELLIHHPNRLLSVGLCNTTTGNQSLPQPGLAVVKEFLKKPKSNSDEDVIEFTSKMHQYIIYSRLPDADWEWIRARSRRTLDHAPRNPSGNARQLWAIQSAKPRDEALAKLDVSRIPTMVMVGLKDILVHPAHGYHLASLIQGSKLVTVDDMPHGLLKAHRSVVTHAIKANANRQGGRG